MFVQTNEPAGNRIVVYDRAKDGTLTPAGSYATGGLGGAAAPGTESDRIASQGSLVYDREHKLLFAVNAGSDSVSTFSVHGDTLSLENVVPSGGQFPASIAVHHDLVYVLNAGGTGTVQGFRIGDDGLTPIAGSTRTLGLANTTPPNFLTSPGQVGFTPDGRQLLVTTKASTSTIDVFQVGHDGLLSPTFVREPVRDAGAVRVHVRARQARERRGRRELGHDVPARARRHAQRPEVAERRPGGAVLDPARRQLLLRLEHGQQHAQLVRDRRRAADAARRRSPRRRSPARSTSPSPKGTRFLYAETGSGTVDEYRVNGDGTLTQIGTVTGLPPGIEGIASNYGNARARGGTASPARSARRVRCLYPSCASRVHTFETTCATCGLPIEPPRLKAPAAKTCAPFFVS